MTKPFLTSAVKPMVKPAAAVSVAAGVALLLASCSQPIAVAPPITGDQVTNICLDISRELPESVNGHDKRTVVPMDIRTAAWGDPPIVFRCGVLTPTELKPTSVVTSVNGVDWFPLEHTGGYKFTTTGRLANIEITVPSDYAPEATVLADFSELIKKFDKQIEVESSDDKDSGDKKS